MDTLYGVARRNLADLYPLSPRGEPSTGAARADLARRLGAAIERELDRSESEEEDLALSSLSREGRG